MSIQLRQLRCGVVATFYLYRYVLKFPRPIMICVIWYEYIIVFKWAGRLTEGNYADDVFIVHADQYHLHQHTGAVLAKLETGVFSIALCCRRVPRSQSAAADGYSV